MQFTLEIGKIYYFYKSLTLLLLVHVVYIGIQMLCERLVGRTGILLNWEYNQECTCLYFIYLPYEERKQTQKVNPMIEMKKEEIYELCEKGHTLLL